LPPAYRERLAASRTLTGFPRSACASSDRGGRPLDPEASGVHTTGENCPAAACRSSTARPCTPVLIPSAGALGNEASAGVHSRSPVRSSPRLRSRMERERFGFFPELRTPQLPAAHVRAGTGLEHWPEAMPPTSSVLQPASSLAPCDLVSHVLSPVITHEQPHQLSRSQRRIQSAASGRTISDLIDQCSRPQRPARHPSSDSALPDTGRGTIYVKGSKPRLSECSPAGGHQTPSLPHQQPRQSLLG
jgi:hypothetical protein